MMTRTVSIVALPILVAIFAATLAGCGENSSVTTISGSSAVTLTTPTGPNTTKITVDSGPSSAFLLGLSNVLYTTVTVCAPGTSNCATIDHVLVDTGSIGLRVLASNVQALNLQPVAVAASQYGGGTPAGDAYECYQFVIGGLWGPLVSADVIISGETAGNIPIQLIDNAANPVHPVEQDCVTASNNTIQNSAAALGANGILGIGNFPYDCGLNCATANYAGSFVQYYACAATAGGTCAAAAVPTSPPQQTVNPVAYFPLDNNGTIILLPATPIYGASTAEGRLVFGIGTQANNQILAQMPLYFLNTDPTSPDYLSFTTIYKGNALTNSVIDSGSNGLFFDDPAIPTNCQHGTGGGAQQWYCPAAPLQQTVSFTDGTTTGPVTFSLANADSLFNTPNTAFATLGGSLGLGTPTFVWGLSFFYGRAVYTSISGQVLSTPNNPWYGVANL